MKHTPLHSTHEALGAKMAPFGGYLMPIQYAGIQEEHRQVRIGVGVFDVSHMGEFIVSGSSALKLLQHLCSNDISKLYPGKAQYNYWPNGKGGTVDDLIIYQLTEDSYMLVVNAANLEKDWAWIQQHNESFGAQLTDISPETVLLAVQGPKAIECLSPLTSAPLKEMKVYTHLESHLGACPQVRIATTGYTGSGGVEIYAHKDQAENLWKTIMEAGQAYNIQPIGLGARDTLRLEMGYCLYGHELEEDRSPIAAGLGWVTKPDQLGIDQKLLSDQKLNGTPQKLIGFKMEERGIPRQDYPILNTAGETVGRVSSGTQSPSLNQGIGLGFVETEYATVETPLLIQIRKKQTRARVIKLPFWKS